MAMQRARKLALEPDSTFDIDGDGCVSNEDFKRASLFDVNKDGVLQSDEQRSLRREMVKDTINEVSRQPSSPPLRRRWSG
jgi:hypothetical protein|eukprot:SAG25_NODE_299_length_10186_cov_64.813621_11_plen_80_part_00